MVLLHEYDDPYDGFDPGWDDAGESDAHPPLEPVHYVVCVECGDELRPCDCGVGVTDHSVNEEVCDDCAAEAMEDAGR